MKCSSFVVTDLCQKMTRKEDKVTMTHYVEDTYKHKNRIFRIQLPKAQLNFHLNLLLWSPQFGK